MPDTTASTLSPTTRQSIRLMLIACMTFTEFVHSAVSALNAAPIMGDIGASPREYSAAATLYAVVAIAAIALQRWSIERLGWRRFVQLSMLSFAAGIVVVVRSGDLAGFMAGRALMAVGGALFMTGGRVLVNHTPPSPARFQGIRCFALGLGVGTTLGPLLATMALDAHGWRTSFLVLLVPAAVVGVLATAALPSALPAHALRTQARPLPLLLWMGACLVFLHALQQSSFDYFSDATPLLLGGLVAVLGAGLFIWLELRARTALIRFADLAQTRYLVGAALFAVCYLMLAANNYVMPVLLQRGMGLPLEQVGHAMSIGAAAGLLTLVVMLKFLPRHPGPTRYYAVALGGLLMFGFWLSRLSESAHPAWLVVPALVCHGSFVVLALATTAMQTFKNIPENESAFSHANQVKNMLAQFATASGIAMATLVLQWRSSVRYTQLVETLGPNNTAWTASVDQLAQHIAATHGPEQATQMAVAQLAQLVTQEATLLAAQDYFGLVAIFALACIALLSALRFGPYILQSIRRQTLSDSPVAGPVRSPAVL